MEGACTPNRLHTCSTQAGVLRLVEIERNLKESPVDMRGFSFGSLYPPFSLLGERLSFSDEARSSLAL